MPRFALGDVIREADPGFASGKRSPEGVLQVRMNCVDPDGGLDLAVAPRVPPIPRLSQYLLEPGDVVFNATNSPELVGKSALFTGSHEPVAFSNHFLRIRVRPERLQPAYLVRWLASQWRRRVFEGMCTQWVNQAAIRKDRLLQLRIPLPPLAEQRRIAALLDKADALRRKRREGLRLLEEFLRSAFLEMFGDPVRNEKGWEVRPLAKIAQVERGKFTPRPRNDPRFYGGPFPFIQTGDIAQSGGVVDSWQQTLNEQGTMVSRQFPAGTIALAIAANIADTAIVEFDFYCPDSVVGIVAADGLATPDYLESCLRFFKPLLAARAPMTAQRNINLQVLRPLEIPTPPVDLQRLFGNLRRSVRRTVNAMRGYADAADHLFDSLARRAFGSSS